MLSLPSIFFGRASLSEAPWSGVPSEFRCSFTWRSTVAYHLQQYCNEPVNVFLNNWFTQEESSRVKSNVTISFSTDSIDPCGIKDRNMGRDGDTGGSSSVTEEESMRRWHIADRYGTAYNSLIKDFSEVSHSLETSTLIGDFSNAITWTKLTLLYLLDFYRNQKPVHADR